MKTQEVDVIYINIIYKKVFHQRADNVIERMRQKIGTYPENVIIEMDPFFCRK